MLFNMGIEFIQNFMSNPKLNFILRLKPNENQNKVLLKAALINEKMGIYSRARPAINYLLV